MEEPITFQATLSSIRTTVDGGVNITLSIPECQSEVVKNLLDAKNTVLCVAIVPE